MVELGTGYFTEKSIGDSKDLIDRKVSRFRQVDCHVTSFCSFCRGSAFVYWIIADDDIAAGQSES